MPESRAGGIRQNVPGADRAEIGWTLVDTRGERSTTNEVLLVRADPETHEAIVGFLTRLRNGAPLPAPKAEPVSRKATATDMVALFRDLEAAGATERASAGINKNSYKETDKGFQSTCRVRGKDGRWIPLTRDWTAK